MRFGCVSAVLAVSTLIGFAEPKINPYGSIADRNVFRLKDPPPPVSFHQPPPPRPVPNLLLTGVADFSTAKWAFITRTDPGRPAKNCTLTLGETEEGLQLIDINANKATVTLLVDGIDTVTLKLSSATNRPPPPTHPAKVPAPVFSRLR
jgi:hypothetical protein